jgi:hypothetical protein
MRHTSVRACSGISPEAGLVRRPCLWKGPKQRRTRALVAFHHLWVIKSWKERHARRIHDRGWCRIL